MSLLRRVCENFRFAQTFRFLLLLQTKRKELTALETALAGALAGATTGAVTTPLDVIKTRLMVQVGLRREVAVRSGRPQMHLN
jgi:solute carrier family 25 S-adenosylmethionine transporter 26